VLFQYSPNLLLDYVVVNSAPISAELRQKYLDDGAAQVEFDSTLLRGVAGAFQSSIDAVGDSVDGFQLICSDLLQEDGLVRHDPDKLARLVLQIHQAARLAVGL
jgi:hypothetical protein